MFAGKLKRKHSADQLSISNSDVPMSGTSHSKPDEEFLSQRHPNDPPPKLHHHGHAHTHVNTAPTSTPIAASSQDIIDLTGDSSPDTGKSSLGLGSKESLLGTTTSDDTSVWDNSPALLDDYQYALKLQAQLNGEVASSTSAASWQKKPKLQDQADEQWQSHFFDANDDFYASTFPSPWANSTSASKSEIPPLDMEASDAELARMLDQQYRTEAAMALNQVSTKSMTSDPPDQDYQLQDATLLHEYGRDIFRRSCASCNKHLFYSEADISNNMKANFVTNKKFTSAHMCNSCCAQTCVGCGRHALDMSTKECNPFAQSDPVVISWHCPSGQLFVLWAVLSFIPHRDDPQGRPAQNNPARGKPTTAKSNQKAGIGYGDNRSRRNERVAPFEGFTNNVEDNCLRTYFSVLQEICPNWNSKSCMLLDGSKDALLGAMFRRSALLDKMAELLRNDSIDNVASRPQMYNALVNLIETLGNHPVTAQLIFHERYSYNTRNGLLAISFGDQPSESEQVTSLSQNREKMQGLLSIMKGLKTQASMFSKQARGNAEDFANDDDAQNVLILADRIFEVYENLSANGLVGTSTTTVAATTAGAGEESANSAGKRPAQDDRKAAIEWHRENCVTEVSDDEILKYHEFSKRARDAHQVIKGRMKKLVMELTTCQSSLPEGIFVKHGSSRLDVMKVLIVGPRGTPYENGLFEFDVYCGEQYPNMPPEVKFKTTGGGRAHFNPNLYTDGKVCLSLLGTWSGEPWRPGVSTLLQVFVSIQGMILCEEPWCNEPGRELQAGTSQSFRYTEQIRLLTTEHAVRSWIDAKSKTIKSKDLWASIIDKHFSIEGERILYTVKRWAHESQYDGALRSHFGNMLHAPPSWLGPGFSSPVPHSFHEVLQETAGLTQDLQNKHMKKLLDATKPAIMHHYGQPGPPGPPMAGTHGAPSTAPPMQGSSAHGTPSSVAPSPCPHPSMSHGPPLQTGVAPGWHTHPMAYVPVTIPPSSNPPGGFPMMMHESLVPPGYAPPFAMSSPNSWPLVYGPYGPHAGPPHSATPHAGPPHAASSSLGANAVPGHAVAMPTNAPTQQPIPYIVPQPAGYAGGMPTYANQDKGAKVVQVSGAEAEVAPKKSAITAFQEHKKKFLKGFHPHEKVKKGILKKSGDGSSKDGAAGVGQTSAVSGQGSGNSDGKAATAKSKADAPSLSVADAVERRKLDGKKNTRMLEQYQALTTLLAKFEKQAIAQTELEDGYKAHILPAVSNARRDELMDDYDESDG